MHEWDELMAIYDDLWSVVNTTYPHYPYVNPPATEEEKRKREIEQMDQYERDRKGFDLKHNAEMAKERQAQDFYLAMAARVCVSVIILAAIISVAPTVYALAERLIYRR